MSASASLQLLPTGWARVHPEPAIEWRRPALLRAHPDTSVLPVMANAQYEQFRADIVERGVQEPLKVSADGLLLDGRERLRAASELGLAQVPVRVVRPADPFEYILACALKRKQLTPSQRAALAVERDTYQQARASAEIRRLANLRQSAEVASLPPRGKTRDSAARWAGVSPRTVQDAATVKAHDPGLFAQVKAGAIAADQAARRVRRRLRDEAIGQPPPPPRGPFQLVYADPPWQLGNPDSRYAPENHYPTLPLEEILALEIPAGEDALLLLWAVTCLLPQAFEVIEAWGFTYKTDIVWVKPSIGLGNWARNRHETLLLASKGRMPLPDSAFPDSVIEALRGRHSEKPAIFYPLIEQTWPQLSKVELFARRARPGWAAWGNQLGRS